MSLLFMDGFDDGLLATKWLVSTGVTIAAGGRTGNRCTVSGTVSHLRWHVAAADEHATFILGFAFKPEYSSGMIDIVRFLGDAGATTHIAVGLNTGGGFDFRRGASGTIIGSTPNMTFQQNTWNYVEILVTLSDSVGVITCKVNNGQVYTVSSADTKNAGTKTVLDGIAFDTATGVYSFGIDDVYLCNGAGAVHNTFLTDSTIQTIYANGNGNYSDWAGSDGNSVNNYQQVDETGTPNTADYNESGTATQKDTYAFSDVSGAATIQGVIHRSHVAKSDAGAQTFRQQCRIAATDYPGSDITPTTSYVQYARVMELSPATAAAWTQAELNGTEFGVEAR